ncbi:MAG: SynChlorMet cassette radical SAM/SPASM protein ScmE [Desulfobacteraceae bacterium 4572_88]|nr:MAG: SynChlorMet cassette radical SAM/SPASM protein ScmE [Desulfobacteraceae bacterium 4572_88]
MRLMNTPKSMDIAITDRCNLKCTYCSYYTSPSNVEGELSKEEWLKFFEELNRCAVMEVTLEGGEAFIRKDLKDIIDGVVRNRMRFIILSNGTLITDEMAAYIASTGRCNHVQVSIDGATAETHDSYRGDGNFSRAVDGIRRLLGHQVPVTVRATIHRRNVKDLEGIAKLLLEDLGLPGFSTNAASHMGLCRQHTDDVQLTTEERSFAMETLLRLNKKYNGRIGASAGPLAEAKTWVEMEKARKEGRETMSGRGFLKGCGGVFSKLDVRADGVMVPCIQMGHIELGRINKDDMKEVWQNHPELIRLRERQDIPLGDFDFCKGCDYIPYCTGNCPALSYNLTGKEDHPSPDACLRRFLEEGGRLPHDI